MTRNLFYNLFTGRRLVFGAPSQTSLCSLPFYFVKTLSTFSQGESNNSISATDAYLQNPFAEFAATKLDFSSADIARMMKRTPSLQRLKTLENVEHVVALLKKYGCTHHQIAKIIKIQPSLLTTSAESVTELKLQLFKGWGLEEPGLPKILTKRPSILVASLERCLLPCLTFLKSIFQSQDLVIKAVLKDPGILAYNVEKILKPSVAFWESYGFRGTELAKFLLLSPSLISFTYLSPGKLELMQKIGHEKGHIMYKHVLRIVARQRLETLEDKFHNFQLCGLTDEETVELFRVSPYVFTLAKDKVRGNMNFIVNNMALPENSALHRPRLLQISLERVLKPRFLVWEKMKFMNEDGHLKLKPLYTILTMTEARFIDVVKKHPKSTMLYAIYQEAVGNASSHRKIARKV